MGANLMATRNRNRVIQTAIETVGRQLREPEVRELLEDLPPKASRTSSRDPRARPKRGPG